MRRAPALLRRLSLGVVDQLLSSGSNFVALLLGARYLDRGEFGSFSLALVTYTLTLGVCRALCSEALLVRPGVGPRSQDRAVREATGAACWIGLAAAIVLVLAALATSGPLAGCLAVLALTIPGLLVQDTLRYAAFSRGTPLPAVVSDGTWVAGQALGLGWLIVTRNTTAPLMLLAWTVPGVLAGGLQAVRERVVPSVRSVVGWVARNRDLSVRYLLDFLSGAGAAHLASYVLAASAGVAAVGSVRGAQTLFGPVNVLLTGAYIVLVPEGRRAASRSKRSLTLACTSASAAFVLVSAGLLGAFLLVSDQRGASLLGSTWTSARDVLLPVGLASVAGGVVAGAVAGLRSLAAARELLRIRLFTIPTTLALPIGGAVLGDARGLAWGIAASVWWNVGWYWWGYARALRSFDPAVLAAEGPVAAVDPGSVASVETP